MGSEAERLEVLRAWKEMTEIGRESARKEGYKKMARKVLLEAREEVKEESGTGLNENEGRSSDSRGDASSSPSTTVADAALNDEDEIRWSRELDMALSLSLQTQPSSAQGPGHGDSSQEAEDKEFQESMERAIQRSLEETH